jgi:hypothetical protein
LGLLLRSSRERIDRDLESIRDEIGVPKVDLVALESGELTLLHTERAAAVALWRYSELLGLDSEALVRIVHEHWPKPIRGSLSIQTFSGIELPVARVTRGTDLLEAIEKVGRRTPRSHMLGLSPATRSELAAASARRNLGYEILGPARPSRKRSIARVRPSEEPAIESSPLPELESSPLPELDPVALESVPGTETGDVEVVIDAAPSEVTNERELVVLEELVASTSPSTVDEGLSDSVAEEPDVAELATNATTPTPAVDEVESPSTEDEQSEQSRRLSRFRKLGKKRTDAPSMPRDDDASLEVMLANVPADRQEALLRAAVDRLNPTEREVLRLVIWDELSTEDAAARLSMPEPQLLELLGRARRDFRRELIALASAPEFRETDT